MPHANDEDVASTCNAVAEHIGADTERGEPLAHVVVNGFAGVRLLDQAISGRQDQAGGTIARRGALRCVVQKADEVLHIVERLRGPDQRQGRRSPRDICSSQPRTSP